MNACFYVIYKQWENRLRDQIRKPKFWIISFIVAAYFALYFYQEIHHIGTSGVIHNAVPIFQGGVTLVFLVYTFIGFTMGLKRGDAFFRQADISMLFVSPVSPKKILFYGLIKQFIGSIVATLVLLMQLTNLRFYFGLGLRELLILMAAWLMLSLSLSALSMPIYAMTATRPSLRRILLLFVYVNCGVVIFGIAVALWRSGTPLHSIFQFFNNGYLHQIPFGGWCAGFLVNMMAGNYKEALAYIGMTAVFPLLGILVVGKCGSDYYEDVMTSIGNIYGSTNVDQYWLKNRHIKSMDAKKMKSRLVGHRRGEFVFLQRQLTEQKRSLAIFFDKGSLGMLAFSVVLGSVMHSLMRKGMYPFIMQIITVAILSYLLFFTMPMGRFVEELRKPFIYLTPGHPVGKLLSASAASAIKAFVESLLCLSVVAAFAKLHPGFVLCGSVFYASAALLFSGAFSASIRTLGLTNSKNAQMALSFAIVSAVFLFEVSAGASIGSRLYAMDPSLFMLVFVIFGVFNMLVALFFFSCSKSILEYRD